MPDRRRRPTAGPERGEPHARIVASIQATEPEHLARDPCTAAVIMPPQPLQTAAADEDRHAGRERAHAGADDEDRGAVSRVTRVPVRRTTTELPALPRMAVTA
jgi:hypothetical protein